MDLREVFVEPVAIADESRYQRLMPTCRYLGALPAILILTFSLLGKTGLVIELTRIEPETRRVTRLTIKPDTKMRIAGTLLKVGETHWYVARWWRDWMVLIGFCAAALKCWPPSPRRSG